MRNDCYDYIILYIAEIARHIIWFQHLLVRQFKIIYSVELIEGIQQCYSEDILDRLNLPAKEKWLKEEELLYHHLSLDRRVLIDSLLRGAVTSEQYPPARSRVIKIYIASTASGKVLLH